MSDVIILAEAVHDHEATMLGRYFNPLTVAKFSQKWSFCTSWQKTGITL